MLKWMRKERTTLRGEGSTQAQQRRCSGTQSSALARRPGKVRPDSRRAGGTSRLQGTQLAKDKGQRRGQTGGKAMSGVLMPMRKTTMTGNPRVRKRSEMVVSRIIKPNAH